MAYTDSNYKTKKALKEAVASGLKVRIYNLGLGQDYSSYTGEAHVEGPHYPAPHAWYAAVHLTDGFVDKVK